MFAPPGLNVEDLTLSEFAEARDGQDEYMLNEMSEQEATKKGFARVSAVMDKGAEEHALPEDVTPWIPLQPSPASKAGKGFRGAGGDRIPARGRRVMVGKTAEGQSRKIAWEVCPVKRALLSVKKMTRTGNMAWFGEDRAFIKNLTSGEVTQLRTERNVCMLDIWVPKPQDEAPGFTRQEGR